MAHLLIGILFLFSGAAGLIYQVVWMRKLSLILGMTSHAVCTVLVVFMGGLALGSWLIGPAGDVSRSPLRLYGWLELGIALFGFQSTMLLDGLMHLSATIGRSGTVGEGLLPWLRVLLACIVLVGPTTLMGAALPVLLKGVCRTPERIARESGLLYGINTLGAVMGTLLAAFWLIEHAGIRAATFVAASINLLVGVVALRLAQGAEAQAHVAPSFAEDPTNADRRSVRAVVLAFGVSGFSALACEVLWTRYLVFVMRQNSVYAFATMLAAILTGIALGSLLAAVVVPRLKDPVTAFGGLLVLIGASVVMTVVLMGYVQEPIDARGGAFWHLSVRKFLRCMLILILPTTLSGSSFALVTRVCARDQLALARDAGSAYAVNTLGAIFGAMVGGFVLLPRLGLTKGLVAVAAVNVLTGFALLLGRRSWRAAIGTALVTGALTASAFSSLAWVGTPLDPRTRADRSGFLYYADGPESSVAVTRNSETGDIYLMVDDEVQSGTSPATQMHLRLLGHLPMLLHSDPKRVLVVGFGAGITTGCVAQHPVERVDVVELSPAVIEASYLFAPFNHDPIPYVRQGEGNKRGGAKVNLIVDDGRNFLLRTDQTYDVITSDPVDPDDAGMTSLYSQEYYELLRDHLNDGGVVSQWMTTKYDPDDYRMLVRTFQQVFPKTSIWSAGFTTVLVGLKGDPGVTLEDLRRRMAFPAVRQSLEVIGVSGPETMLALMLAGPDQVRRFSGDGPLNTDDRPRIEYLGPRQDSVGDPRRGLLRELVAMRTPERSSVIAGWSATHEAACAPAQSWMDTALEHDPFLLGGLVGGGRGVGGPGQILVRPGAVGVDLNDGQ